METRRQARGRLRIQQILDAASQILDEDGYEALTTNAIAARAGMSPGSLYQFFDNREAILAALADRYQALIDATYESALDLQAARLPLEVLVDRVVDPLVDLHLSNPALKTLLSGPETSPTLTTPTRHLHDSVLCRVEALIAVRLPSLSDAERSRVARVTLQIFKAIQPLVLEALPRERPALIADLKAALIGYLRTVEQDATGVTQERR